MKKTTMQTLVNYFAIQNDVPAEVAEAVDELKAELNRGAEKAQKNRDFYEAAKAVVFDGLRVAGKPVTISELYDEIAGELPEGFTKSKLQYAVTRLWAGEIDKTEGKVNTYAVKEGV